MSTRNPVPARLDRLVADVLADFSGDADIMVRIPKMEAPVDAIWADALLVELIAGRLAAGAESLGVSIRLGEEIVEITTWDDGELTAHCESVHLIAAKLGARVSEPQVHAGRLAVFLAIPF